MIDVLKWFSNLVFTVAINEATKLKKIWGRLYKTLNHFLITILQLNSDYYKIRCSDWLTLPLSLELYQWNDSTTSRKEIRVHWYKNTYRRITENSMDKLPKV